MQQNQQQHQHQRPTFYRANRPGNLNIVDDSIIENTSLSNHEPQYMTSATSAPPGTPNHQFALQKPHFNTPNAAAPQQQQQQQPPYTPNTIQQQQQQQMAYKMHPHTPYVQSPQSYSTVSNNTVPNSPHLIPQQQQQQQQQQQAHNMIPVSPSYATYPATYTPNRTVMNTSNSLASPFINPAPPPPTFQYATAGLGNAKYCQAN